MKEKGSASLQAVVLKCLGEMLAMTPRCLPPTTCVVGLLMESTWMMIQAMRDGSNLTSPYTAKMG